MTAPAPEPIFQSTLPAAAPAALVSLTVTGAVVFTDVRCPCKGKVMEIPGIVEVEVRALASREQASGQGRIVVCRRHKPALFLEVIEGP